MLLNNFLLWSYRTALAMAKSVFNAGLEPTNNQIVPRERKRVQFGMNELEEAALDDNDPDYIPEPVSIKFGIILLQK